MQTYQNNELNGKTNFSSYTIVKTTSIVNFPLLCNKFAASAFSSISKVTTMKIFLTKTAMLLILEQQILNSTKRVYEVKKEHLLYHIH